MITKEQYLSETIADGIRQQLVAMDKAYWRDRSRHKPNLGLDGEAGRYFSCGRLACRSDIRTMIDDIAPDYPGYELDDWVINWTQPGGGLPPHIDNEGYLAIGVLCLQGESGAFVWYQENDLDQPQTIADKAGQLLRFNDISLIHAVPPALTNRYIIVFLYR